MSIVLSVHLEFLSWTGLAILVLAPVIAGAGIRGIRSRLKKALRRASAEDAP